MRQSVAPTERRSSTVMSKNLPETVKNRPRESVGKCRHQVTKAPTCVKALLFRYSFFETWCLVPKGPLRGWQKEGFRLFSQDAKKGMNWKNERPGYCKSTLCCQHLLSVVLLGGRPDRNQHMLVTQPPVMPFVVSGDPPSRSAGKKLLTPQEAMEQDTTACATKEGAF